MNAQQLKNSILQDAIMGKLVPQDPNDEPASVLLDKIRKEKARLVKEGKLKKKDLIETPINKDEIPFEIPEGWEWVRIKEVSACVTDGDHLPPPQTSSGIPFLVISNVITGTLDFSRTRFVPKEYYDKLSDERKAKENDLLFTVTGSYGKAILVSTNRFFCFQRHIALIRPLLCFSKYLLHVLNSSFIKNECDKKATGMAQKTVGLDVLRSLIIPLPPLAEQHRIVAKIEELLPKVEEYGKAQEALDKLNAELPERLKKSILQEAIMGRLVPQDPNDEPASVLLDKIRKEKAWLVKEGKLKKKDLIETPISEDEISFEIPKEWEWVRISDVVNITMGQSPDGDDVYEAKEVSDAFEFHQGKICFTEKYIAPSGKWCKNPSRTANVDSLLICVRAPIGDVNITKRTIGIGRGLAAMEGYGGVLTIFLFYWMLAHKRCLIEQGTGSTFKAITVEVLKKQPIPLPPLTEQHRIVARIEELLAKIDKLKTN